MDSYKQDSSNASSSSPPELPVMFRAICLYDFYSEDPSHLGFKRGDLLAVLQTDSSGWSGARNKYGAVGWVPTEYLAPLTDESVRNLESVVDDSVRFYSYEAEIKYRNAPVLDANRLLTSHITSPSHSTPNGRDTFSVCLSLSP